MPGLARSGRSRAGPARGRRCARGRAPRRPRCSGRRGRRATGTPSDGRLAPDHRQAVELAASDLHLGHGRDRYRRRYGHPRERDEGGIGGDRRAAGSARSATACARSTASRARRPTARRSTSWSSPCSRRAPTTATATSPTRACASASRPGRRCATRRSRRSRRRSARAGSRRSSPRRIQEILRGDRATRSSLALDARRRRSRRAARLPRARCPASGRKTAACVLLFSYGLRDVPVDTHVSRVGTRLEPAAPGRAASMSSHDADARPHRAGRGARAAREPAAPRPAHVLRPAPPRARNARCAACARAPRSSCEHRRSSRRTWRSTTRPVCARPAARRRAA